MAVAGTATPTVERLQDPGRTEAWLEELPPSRPASARSDGERARDLIRSWLRTGRDDVLRGIGRDAVRAAADTVGRLAPVTDCMDPGGALANLERAVADLSRAHADRSPRWWNGFRPRRTPPSAKDVADLLDGLGRQTDVTALETIRLNGEWDRISSARADLKATMELIRAVGLGAEAAGRELAASAPDRAAAVRSEAAAILLDRERAVLTQLAVTDQALLAVDILLANQVAAADALESARTATLSALQVARTAERAVSRAQALSAVYAAPSVGAQRGNSTGADNDPMVPLGLALGSARAAIGALGARNSRWLGGPRSS